MPNQQCQSTEGNRSGATEMCILLFKPVILLFVGTLIDWMSDGRHCTPSVCLCDVCLYTGSRANASTMNWHSMIPESIPLGVRWTKKA